MEVVTRTDGAQMMVYLELRAGMVSVTSTPTAARINVNEVRSGCNTYQTKLLQSYHSNPRIFL